MTQKQKEKQILGIVFLVLTVLCAGLYAWLSSPASWEGFVARLAETGTENQIPFTDLVSSIAQSASALFAALSALLLAFLGWILALGTTLLCTQLPLKIAGGVGIALHVTLLVVCIVRYMDVFGALLAF